MLIIDLNVHFYFEYLHIRILNFLELNIFKFSNLDFFKKAISGEKFLRYEENKNQVILLE